MSHEEQGTAHDPDARGHERQGRKERRKAYGGKRKPVVRRPFAAADHIRNDWTPDELIMFLEGSAAGYDGMLRNYLCTAAHHLRVAGATIDRLEGELADPDVLIARLDNLKDPDVETVDCSALMPVGVEDDGS